MIECIKSRKSVRKYTDQKITDEDLHTILEAAMSGPTACNARPWSFIVVRDKEMLEKMANANSKYSKLLKSANVGILICGDLERAVQFEPDFWVIDGSIAIQNMILAAHSLNIGSCWLGTWPMETSIQNMKELFQLPETIVPHSVLALGYSDDEVSKNKVKKLYEEDRVHFEKW